MDWKDFVCLPWVESREIKEWCIATTRVAEAAGHIFAVASVTRKPELKEQHRHTRDYEHYMVDGKLYKSRRTLLKAIKDIEI